MPWGAGATPWRSADFSSTLPAGAPLGALGPPGFIGRHAPSVPNQGPDTVFGYGQAGEPLDRTLLCLQRVHAPVSHRQGARGVELEGTSAPCRARGGQPRPEDAGQSPSYGLRADAASVVNQCLRHGGFRSTWFPSRQRLVGFCGSGRWPASVISSETACKATLIRNRPPRPAMTATCMRLNGDFMRCFR